MLYVYRLLPVCTHLLASEGAAAGGRRPVLLPPVRMAVEVALRGFEGAAERGDLVAGARWQRLLADCGGPWLDLLEDEEDGEQGEAREGGCGSLSGAQLRARLLRAVVQQLQPEVTEGPCRLRGAGGVGMPPPSGVGEELSTCYNPLCTNLTGDSEAGLEAGLQQGGGREGVGRGEAAAGCGWYCSGACAVAHEVAWRRQWGAARTGVAASSVGAAERA